MKIKKTTIHWRPLLAATITLLLTIGCVGEHNDDAATILALLGGDAQALSSRSSDLNFIIAPLDADKDMIADIHERHLMRKFAPMYYLHPSEWALPASVAWLLPHVQMRHNSDNACKDRIVLDWGRATSKNLSRQYARGKGGWPRCKSNGGHYYSHTDYRDEDTFYLSVSSKKYGGSLSAAKCYARVGITSKQGAKYEIDYWFFYPFNPSIRKIANHEGDWEHVTVYVNRNERVHSVDYAAHGDPTNYLASNPKLNLVNGLRPDVYSANGTHASHPNEGKHFNRKVLGINVNEFTQKDPRGVKIVDCAAPGRTINLGNFEYPSYGNEWLKYKGDWGYKKNKFGSRVAGPSGPKTYGLKWNTQARISGSTSFTFPKTTSANQVRKFTFNANLAKLLGPSDSTYITRVATSNRTFASATNRGNSIEVSFRQRRDVSNASYNLTVWYSVPTDGATRTRVTLSRTIRIRVRYAAYAPPTCGNTTDRFKLIPTDCLY